MCGFWARAAAGAQRGGADLGDELHGVEAALNVGADDLRQEVREEVGLAALQVRRA